MCNRFRVRCALAEGSGSRHHGRPCKDFSCGNKGSLHPRKKVCTEAHRASALSAKAERGRVKHVHRQNTLMYYALSRNQTNAKPLEVGGTTMLLPSSALGSDGSNNSAPGQTAPIVAKPMVEVPVSDSAAVAGSPTSESGTHHKGYADYIIISSTSEDGDAETTNDLQEVNVPDSDEDYDEDIETLVPKKKSRKNYDLTQKFQLEWACKRPWAEGILTNNGMLHMVKCTMCSTMEK